MRSEQARYEHRLDAVLLVGSGLGCCHVAEMFGQSLRTVQSWPQQCERSGFSRLAEQPADDVLGAIRNRKFAYRPLERALGRPSLD